MLRYGSGIVATHGLVTKRPDPDDMRRTTTPNVPILMLQWSFPHCSGASLPHLPFFQEHLSLTAAALTSQIHCPGMHVGLHMRREAAQVGSSTHQPDPLPRDIGLRHEEAAQEIPEREEEGDEDGAELDGGCEVDGHDAEVGEGREVEEQEEEEPEELGCAAGGGEQQQRQPG